MTFRPMGYLGYRVRAVVASSGCWLVASACGNTLEQGSALDGASGTPSTDMAVETETRGSDTPKPDDAGATTADDLGGTQINSENQTKGESDEMREAGVPEADTLTESNTIDHTSDGMSKGQSSVEMVADSGASLQETGAAQADGGSGEMALAQYGDVCRSPDECTNGGDINDVDSVMTCYAPWQRAPTGTPPEPPLECTTEEDCYRRGATNDGRFACQGGTCRQSCNSSTCAEGYQCGADGRCELSSCETDAECPSHFACGDTGTCERAECSSDEQCDGYCVNSRCSPDLGRCGYQTAA